MKTENNKAIEMNKELEQKAKEFIDSTPYYGTCTTEYVEGLEDGIKWALQNTITLGTKLDENGEKVDEPCYDTDDCYTDLGKEEVKRMWSRYQKARTVKEWIEYAKELEGLIDQIYTTTNIYSHPFEAISKIQKLTAKTK